MKTRSRKRSKRCSGKSSIRRRTRRKTRGGAKKFSDLPIEMKMEIGKKIKNPRDWINYTSVNKSNRQFSSPTEFSEPETLLKLAIEKGNTAVILSILKKHMKDISHSTLLKTFEYAIPIGSFDIVNLLLEYMTFSGYELDYMFIGANEFRSSGGNKEIRNGNKEILHSIIKKYPERYKYSKKLIPIFNIGTDDDDDF